MLDYREEENNRKCGHVREEVERWNQEALTNQHEAEEACHKKQQLLAKMREIDQQSLGVQNSSFDDTSPSESSPRLPEQRNTSYSIFNLTESTESGALLAGAGSMEGVRRRPGIEGGAVSTGMGRKALRSRISNDDLAFGSYAPSFAHSSSRCSPGFPSPPPKEERDSALEAIGVFSLRGVETDKDKEAKRGLGKDRKSNLMQQLFGALATPVGDGLSASNKMEVLNSPPATNGVRSRREGLLNTKTLHITDSRPAIRAVPSFDDDIEELTL